MALKAKENYGKVSFGELNDATVTSCGTAVILMCVEETKKSEMLRSLFDICATGGDASWQDITSMTIGARKGRPLANDAIRNQ